MQLLLAGLINQRTREDMVAGFSILTRQRKEKAHFRQEIGIYSMEPFRQL